MNALLHAMSKLEIGEYNDLIVSSGCMNLRIDKAVDFTGKLVEKYIKYFKEKDVVFFILPWTNTMMPVEIQALHPNFSHMQTGLLTMLFTQE